MERPFKINGITIPTPDSYSFGIEDMSTSATGRTLDAVMHKDVIDVKDYYECTWDSLSWEDAAILLNAVNGKSQVSWTHADPRVPRQYITDLYYIGKRAGAAFNLNSEDNTWEDIGFTFTKI